MSTCYIQRTIFLPIYVLESYVVYGDRPRVDADLIHDRATTDQLLEIILAFYPHFEINDAAKANHQILQKLFREVVVPRLYNVVVPTQSNPQHFFQAELDHVFFGPHDSKTTVTPESNIDGTRISEFRMHCFGNLRNGRFYLAVENLNEFLKTYKYLNYDELHEIMDGKCEAEEAFHEWGILLQETHQKIEGIKLLLRKSDIPEIERQDLEGKLKIENSTLEHRQTVFDVSMKEIAFISSIVDHHQRILAEHQKRNEEQSLPKNDA